jgi:hypothetical protein
MILCVNGTRVGKVRVPCIHGWHMQQYARGTLRQPMFFKAEKHHMCVSVTS